MQKRLENLTQRIKSRRWLRILVGFLLIAGGILGPFLPVLGIWMLPLGLILLSVDFAWARRWHERLLAWLKRRGYHH